MSDEIEYIEPTQEHVWQMVEVRDSDCSDWVSAKLIGFADDEYRFTAKRRCDPHGACWRYARIPRPLTYAERQAKCGLKVGDRVRFVRRWSTEKLGVHLDFLDEMQDEVEAIGVITVIKKSIRVEFSDVAWWLPYFVLEKVEDREPATNDIGKTVYVVGQPQDEFTLDLVYCVLRYRGAIVRSGDKRFVYELSNLRVKE